MAVQLLPALLMAAAGYAIQTNAQNKARKRQNQLIEQGQDRADDRFEQAQKAVEASMAQYDPKTRYENYQNEKETKRLQLLDQITQGDGGSQFEVGTGAAGQQGGFFDKEKARREQGRSDNANNLATLTANAKGFGGLAQKEAINNSRQAALEAIMRRSGGRMADLGREKASYIRPNGTQMMLGQGLMTVGSMYATGGAA